MIGLIFSLLACFEGYSVRSLICPENMSRISIIRMAYCIIVRFCLSHILFPVLQCCRYSNVNAMVPKRRCYDLLWVLHCDSRCFCDVAMIEICTSMEYRSTKYLIEKINSENWGKITGKTRTCRNAWLISAVIVSRYARGPERNQWIMRVIPLPSGMYMCVWIPYIHYLVQFGFGTVVRPAAKTRTFGPRTPYQA